MSTVVVTGGSRGIGRELVGVLAQRGHRVVTCARRWDPDDEQHGVERVHADLSTSSGVSGFAEWITSLHDSIDVLIHNAAYKPRHDLHTGCSVDPHQVQSQFHVNIGAVIQLTDLLLPLLRRGTDPKVVTVGSVVALSGAPRDPVYAATKAAVHAYGDGLRVTLAPLGIDVVEFVPPLTDTEMSAFIRDRPKTSPYDAAVMLVDALGGSRSRFSRGPNRVLLAADTAVRRVVTRVIG